MRCPSCDFINRPTDTVCARCQAPLPTGGDGVPPPARGPVPRDYDQALIGKHVDYYAPRFARFDREGVSMTWNWPAFFVPGGWLLYRKMYRYFLLVVGLPLIVGMLAILLLTLLGFTAVQPIIVWRLVNVSTWLLVPAIANVWYYRQIRRERERILILPDGQRMTEAIRIGGTSLRWLKIVMGIALMGIVVAIAIPAYQDYMTRARMAEGLQLGRQATQSVDRYVTQHGRLPAHLTDTGQVFAPSRAVRSIHLGPPRGIVHVVVATPLGLKVILFVPHPVPFPFGRLVLMGWTCVTEGLPPHLRLPGCLVQGNPTAPGRTVATPSPP